MTDIEDFWKVKKGNIPISKIEMDLKETYVSQSDSKRLIPSLCVASHDSSKIFGIGFDQVSSQEILLFFHRETLIKTSSAFSMYSDALSSVMDVETDLNSDMLYLAGENNNRGCVIAIRFEQSLKLIASFESSSGCTKYTCIRRIFGSNIFLLGSSTSIIVCLAKTGSFQEIREIKLLNSGGLNNVFFVEKGLIAFNHHENCVFEVSFPSRTDSEYMRYVEYLKEYQRKSEALLRLQTDAFEEDKSYKARRLQKMIKNRLSVLNMVGSKTLETGQ